MSPVRAPAPRLATEEDQLEEAYGVDSPGGEDAVSPLDGSSPVEAEVVRSAEAPF